MKKRIKIQGFLIFCGVIAAVFYYKYLIAAAHRNSALNNLLNILGVLMIFWGYLLRIIARGYKAEMNPDGKTLVTQGPYALTRNPMYLGTLLIGLGIILLLFKWWVSFIFLIIYSIIYIPQVNREEEILFQRFGDTFRQYCRNTPKYCPSIIKILLTNPREYLRIRSSWVKKELSSFILIFVFIIGIKILASSKY